MGKDDIVKTLSDRICRGRPTKSVSHGAFRGLGGVRLKRGMKKVKTRPIAGTAPAMDVVAAMSLGMRTVWSEDELATTHSSRTDSYDAHTVAAVR